MKTRTSERFVLDEFLDLAKEILNEQWKIKPLEALKIAGQVQRNKIERERNRIFANAFAVSGDGDSAPSALEAIAMQLGYGETKGATVVDAINNLNNNI